MKKILIVLSMISMFLLGSCGAPMPAEAKDKPDNPIKIWAQNENAQYQTLCVVDEDTGVQYIVVSGALFDKPIGVAITPRLNADGSLYTKRG